MSLLSLRSVSIAFGGPPVLDRADFGIERGERVCLLGRNGAGKTTVMKLLDRSIAPDDGEVVWQTGITVTRLAQEIPDDVAGTTTTDGPPVTFDVLQARAVLTNPYD